MEENLKTEIVHTLTSAAIGLRLAEEGVKNGLLALGYIALQCKIETVLEKIKQAEANHGN